MPLFSFFRVINTLYNEGGETMLLSNLMIDFLSSDLSYGILIIGIAVATLVMNIVDDKRGK